MGRSSWTYGCASGLGPSRVRLVDIRSPADRAVGIREGVGILSVSWDRSGVEVGETSEWVSGLPHPWQWTSNARERTGIDARNREKERSERSVTRADQTEAKLRAYFWIVRK